MPAETLRVVLGAAAGTEIHLDDTFTLGRTESGDGSLGGDPELSRQHARISRTGDGALEITDLGSTNGTHVNGVRILNPYRLSPGDTIRVGQTTLNVHGEPTGPAAERTVIGAMPPGVGSQTPEAPPPAPSSEPPAPSSEPPPPPPPIVLPAPPPPQPGSGESAPPPQPASSEQTPPLEEVAPVEEAAPPVPPPPPPGDEITRFDRPPSPPPPLQSPPQGGEAARFDPPPPGAAPFAPPAAPAPAPAGEPGTQGYGAQAWPPAVAGAYGPGGPPVAAPPVGPPVPTAGSDAPSYALKRPIGRQILLFILSFGLWGFYWFYDTRKKLNAELGKPDDAAVKTACMLIPIYNLVLIYQLWEDLNQLRTRSFGLPEYNSAVLLIVAALVPFGVFYSYPKVATELNQYWDVRTQGRATEAPLTSIEKIMTGIGAAVLALYVLVIVIVIIAAAAGS